MHNINESFTYAYNDGSEDDFGQAVTADAISTNVIKLASLADATKGINIGGAKRPWLIIKSKVASATSVSCEIQLVNSTEAALTGGTTRQIAAFRFLQAQMTAGALLVNTQLPAGKYLDYLGLNFNVFTNDTAVEFEAYLSDAPEPNELTIDLEMAGS